MRRQKPAQLHNPVATDFGFSELPQSSASASRFGKGFTIGAVICFGGVAASFLSVFLVRNDLIGFQRAGYILLSFGGSFLFAILYTVFTHREIPCSAAMGSKSKSAVLDRRRNPMAFWFVVLLTIALATLLIAGGVWLRFHAGTVYEFFKSQ